MGIIKRDPVSQKGERKKQGGKENKLLKATYQRAVLAVRGKKSGHAK